MQSSHAFRRMYTLKSKAAIIKCIKHDILSVSKSAAYQKYVHVKVCLERGYIQSAWRKVKMTFISAPGKVYYNQAKAYCPISLLSCMRKLCKNWLLGTSRTKHWDMTIYLYNNLPTNQGSIQKPQNIMWLHIYREQWKTGSYMSAFLDIQGASDRT